ncbi:hypothetical protein N752_10110 [Desulforamulus aquiferis]|nr:hypothetical protein N752_10110 [Desulforamulus aquiferis]
MAMSIATFFWVNLAVHQRKDGKYHGIMAFHTISVNNWPSYCSLV